MTIKEAIEWLEDINYSLEMPIYLKPDIREIINALKENAQNVKHGRWVKLYHGNYKCSECGSWWGSDYNDEVINDFNYCPNCGAKIDLTRWKNDLVLVQVLFLMV